MVTKSLDRCEWYPVLVLDEPNPDYDEGLPEEFSEDELVEYNRVMNEFCELQQKIADRFGIYLKEKSDVLHHSKGQLTNS